MILIYYARSIKKLAVNAVLIAKRSDEKICEDVRGHTV